VYFAGAWASYGFHEDGIKAGVAVARLLGADVLWGAGICTSPKMGLTDMLWLALFDRWVVCSHMLAGQRSCVYVCGDPPPSVHADAVAGPV
jgi:uncharacterized membrane protein YccF (DUF307 family)